jgi:peptidoglycan/xylan/chitin deacetylase (PgdA/CDA1 family)
VEAISRKHFSEADNVKKQPDELINKIVAFDYFYFNYKNQPELIFKFNTDESIVLLTFDAGSSTGYYREILSTLKEHSVHATFFVTGKWAVNNKGAIYEIFDQGSDVANHSYAHPNFVEAGLGADGIKSQIEKTESIIEGEDEVTQMHFFRFPYGSYAKDLIEAVANIGYVPFQWSIDSLGWMGNLTPVEIKNRILTHIYPGCIIMFHVGSVQDSQALDTILDALEGQAYDFFSISEYFEYLYN